MNIIYITNVRIPTVRAQGYAVMKMCSAFVKAGAKVNLFVPTRGKSKLRQNPFDFYGIEKNFEIKKVPSFDFLGWTIKFGQLFYWLDILSFLIVSRLKIKIRPGDIIYTRDFMTTLFFSKKNPIYLEIHDIPSSRFLFRRAIKKARLIFVLNSYLKTELIKLGVLESIIRIAPSGIEIKDFDINQSKEEARRKLDLPLDKKIALYSGHLYSWKGADILARAAKFLPEIIFVFVGGAEPELSRFKKEYKNQKNIIILPFVERNFIPPYLKSADVLVLPNSAQEKISSNYTSPLKLFEYMAAKRPIIASDLPSIREILDEKSCVFAKAGDEKSFADAIMKILSEAPFGTDLAEKAYENVKKYAWQDRAQKILDAINEDSF